MGGEAFRRRLVHSVEPIIMAVPLLKILLKCNAIKFKCVSVTLVMSLFTGDYIKMVID